MNSSEEGEQSQRLVPTHGGYRGLRSYQAALLVYDGTLIFCDRFVEKRSRTHDQMVQAARSGVRNIAEGSVAFGTSKKTELKLTNVARASLEELLGDVEDFLRQHRLRIWDKNAPEALAVRRGYEAPALARLRTAPPETAANILLCWINQASYLLGRQLRRLERDFLDHGGFTENLYKARSQARASQSHPSDRSDASDKSDKSDSPRCPICGSPMRLRIARQGPHAGQSFWGCSAFPGCRGTRPS